MAIKILPYRAGSRSARALADGLGGRVLRLQGSQYRPRRGDTVINWGATQSVCQTLPRLTAFDSYNLINNWLAIRDASNKLEFFRRLQETNLCPRFWTRREDIPDDAFPIVCRTVLAGHSGAGIVMADTRAGLVAAPLYVEYKKKRSEFRIHVGKRPNETVVIAEQQKVKRADQAAEETDFRIRNHANGFIFQRQNIVVPEAVSSAAKEALGNLEIDFGAVDVIWNDREQRPYVLEVNTAPGLEGQTVDDYVQYFRSII